MLSWPPPLKVTQRSSPRSTRSGRCVFPGEWVFSSAICFASSAARGEEFRRFVPTEPRVDGGVPAGLVVLEDHPEPRMEIQALRREIAEADAFDGIRGVRKTQRSLCAQKDLGQPARMRASRPALKYQLPDAPLSVTRMPLTLHRQPQPNARTAEHGDQIFALPIGQRSSPLAEQAIDQRIDANLMKRRVVLRTRPPPLAAPALAAPACPTAYRASRTGHRMPEDLERDRALIPQQRHLADKGRRICGP